MPFVKRDAVGNIIAVSQNATGDFSEEVHSDDPQLLTFVSCVSDDKHMMAKTDLDFVRVVEDLVELLVAKNYIRFTDLPVKAQEKMRKRKTLRGQMNAHLDLLSDEEDGFF